MKLHNLILMLLLVATVGSCTKREELGNKTYYGDIVLALRPLPGTPDADVYFDGKKVGLLHASLGSPTRFKIAVNEPAKLELYVQGTKTLVADTIIRVEKDKTLSLAAANSEELGIKGWISAKPVPAGIYSMQVVNKLSDHYPEKLDLYIFLADPVSLELTETGIILKDFNRNRLHPQLLDLPQKFLPNGMEHTYIGKLKEPGKDEWIFNEGIGYDLFVLVGTTEGAGKFGIYIVGDSNGYIDCTPNFF